MKTNCLYTNLLDSVIYADFSGHQYRMKQAESLESISMEFREKTDELLDHLLQSDSERIVLTLNQICDNHYLLLEKQDEHFEKLKQLITNGKITISTYPRDSEHTHTLVTYTKKLLIDCLKRLCGGEVSSEITYVSSLFPVLGKKNTNTPTRYAIEALLGYYPKIYYDKETGSFFKKTSENKKICSLDALTKNRANGILTAFLKYERGEVLKQNDYELSGKCRIANDYLEPDILQNWIEHLFELDKIAQNHTAYVKNVCNGFTLDAVMQYFLEEKTLLDQKLELWLHGTERLEEIKTGIIEILTSLSKLKVRTAMYIEVVPRMTEFAEAHRDDNYLYNKFAASSGHHKSNMSYQRVFYACLSAIDFVYNVLNSLYASDSGMKEYNFSIHYGSGDTNGVALADHLYDNLTDYSQILKWLKERKKL